MNSAHEDRKGWKRWKDKILHEMATYWINVLYITLFISVFTNYRRLILAHYQISYEDYGVSLIKALILAKVILVAESVRLGRGFEDKPLIFPTVYKAFLFTVFVALFTVLESIIRGFFKGEGTMGAIDEFMSMFTYEWLAGALVVFFAFIPFFGVRELGRVLGERKISTLFFRRRDTSKYELA